MDPCLWISTGPKQSMHVLDCTTVFSCSPGSSVLLCLLLSAEKAIRRATYIIGYSIRGLPKPTCAIIPGWKENTAGAKGACCTCQGCDFLRSGEAFTEIGCLPILNWSIKENQRQGALRSCIERFNRLFQIPSSMFKNTRQFIPTLQPMRTVDI
jgi:hypothetical protein